VKLAKEYLQKAGGDKEKAQQLAAADGWNSNGRYFRRGSSGDSGGDIFDHVEAGPPTATISSYKPTVMERVRNFISSARKGETPSGAPLPGSQLAGHLAEMTAPASTEGGQPSLEQTRSRAGEIAKDATGARGYGEMGGAVKDYTDTFTHPGTLQY
jgi:hypothetical protein